MLEAKGEWALFTDADLSSPLEELEKLMAGVEVLRRVLVTGMLEITGAVLRGRTVTAKLVLLERAPVSVTESVIMDVPVWPPARMVTVRFAPLRVRIRWSPSASSVSTVGLPP